MRIGKTFSATDLAGMEFHDPDWVVTGLIPPGLTLLAGKPKIGKSWLALNLALDVAGGTTSLGVFDVAEPMPVLYLALEDTQRRLRGRLDMVLGDRPCPDGLRFATGAGEVGDEGDPFANVPQLHQEIKREGIGLLIIDTLARVRGNRPQNGNQYAADYKDLAEIKKIADGMRVATIVVHHTRKAAAEDPLDEVSGTNGIAGAADTVMVMRKEAGGADAMLYLRGRDIEEASYGLAFDAGVWTVTGDASSVRRSSKRNEVLDYVAAHPGSTPTEVADGLGRDRNNVKQLLHKAKRSNEVTAREGRYYPTDNPVTDNGGTSDNPDNRGNRDDHDDPVTR